ncbi:MAG: cytochrome c3 family protein [Acidimicrobiia bacterium]|nr:cytochrome c3 family protein [Acidimicrobiia bacterium]
MTKLVRFRVPGAQWRRIALATTLSVVFGALTFLPAAAGPDQRADTAATSMPFAILAVAQAVEFPDPHGLLSAATNGCLSCHDVHNAAGTTLLATATEKEACYRCHDGSGSTSDIRAEFGESNLGESTQPSYHPLPHALDGYSVTCGDCHTPHQARSEFTKLLRINDGSGGWVYSPVGTPIGNTYCYRCHGAASPFPAPFGDQTAFDGGVHQMLGGDPPSGSGIQCVNCHNGHGSAYPGLSQQEATCFTCHNTATPNTNPDLPFDTTDLEYAFTAAANDYDPTDADGLIRIYHHPIGDHEQDVGSREVECASCHNAHRVDREYSATGSKISNPGDTRGDVAITWTDGTFTRGTISQFCVACHQDPTTTAPINAGTWVPYDVRLTNDSAVLNGSGGPHDTFDATYYFTNERSDHGAGAQLACTACHDPHGSSNSYLLREYVISPGQAGVPAGTVGPRVTGFIDEDTPEQQAILSDFCGSCHGDHHTPNRLCTQCHNHGSTRF